MTKTFISYAQNHEDVVLNRAFSAVQNGFYVDVGAADPVTHSVTKAFYDRGWNGINIDALPDEYQKLKSQRKRDINLNLGIGNSKKEITFYEYPQCPGWSTFSRELVDDRIQDKAPYSFVKRRIQIVPLNEIFNRYCQKKTVHFLKIDVEGFEDEIIEGFNWKCYRPIVVVVEKNKRHGKWISFMAENEYLFCLDDGLNKYFLRNEDTHLKGALSAPAYCVDQFVPYNRLQLEGRILQLEKEITHLKAQQKPWYKRISI